MQKQANILDWPRPDLDPQIFNAGSVLKPEVKKFILDFISSFAQANNFKDVFAWITDIKFVGSLTTNCYNSNSDMDIHIVVDLPKFVEIEHPEMSEQEASDYLDAIRKQVDQVKAKVPGTEHPTEIYFENKFTTIASQEFSGTYSVLNDEWLKYPHIVDQTFDIEKLHPELLNLAKETASELDSAFGEIKRDVQDIKELQDTINDWPVEQRDLFEKKLQKRLETLEAEITELVDLREDVAEKRKHYKALSEQEVRFKYLQKYFYMHVLTDLKTLLKQSPDLSMKDISVVENIMQQASLNKKALVYGYWIDPSGKEFVVSDWHEQWIKNEEKFLKNSYGLDIPKHNSVSFLVMEGWTRITTTSDAQFTIMVKDLRHLPAYLNTFVIKNFNQDKATQGEGILIDQIGGEHVEIIDPFPTLQQAVNKALSQKRMQQANLKEAAKDTRGTGWWIDNTGKIIKLNEGQSHREWAQENSPNADYDALIANGWTRVRDQDGQVLISLADINNIPESLNALLSSFKHGPVTIEDNLGNLKSASKHEDSAEGRICIDFDQTIALDKENGTIEKPEPNAKAAIDKLKADGWYIIIFSHRSSTEYGEDQIKEFLDKYDIPYDEIYTEKPNAEFFIDDRAITFTTWDEVLKKVETKDVPEKRADLTISANARYFIDPNGKVYPVDDTHEAWIYDNTKLLQEQYGLWKNHPEELYPEETDNIDAIIPMMLRDGWTRVGDLFDLGKERLYGKGIEIADLNNVPQSTFDFISQWGKDKSFTIEDLQHRYVDLSVEELIADGQEAINRALQREQMKVHAALDLPIIDPNTLNRKEPYALFIGTQRYSKDVAVDLFDVFGEHPMITEHNRVPTVTLDTLVKENIPVIGKEPRAGDKHPFQDLSSVVKTAQLGSSYDYSSTHFLLPKELSEKIIRWAIETIPEEQIVHDEKDPGTKGIQLDSHITLKYGLHTNDFEDVKKALEGQKAPHIKFGNTSFFEPEGKDYDVIIIKVESDDIQKLNETLCDNVEHDDLQFKEYHPHVTVAYVTKGLGKQFDGKDIITGEELVLPELIFSPKTGEKRTLELKGTNKESSFMPSNTDLAPSDDWAGTVGYPSNESMDAPQNVSDEETWYSPENDRPRSKNFLKRMLSLFQKPLSKKEPKEIVPVKEAEVSKKANSKQYWIDPNGTFYPLEGELHKEWIQNNFELLQTKYGFKIPDLLFQQREDYNKEVAEGREQVETADVYGIWEQMINQGWIRIGDGKDWDSGYQIELRDIHHIPNYVDNFVSENPTKQIEVEDKQKNFVTIVNPASKDINKAVNQALRSPTKTATVKEAAEQPLGDLTQFALDDKQIRQHFKNRGTTVEDVISSLPNFSIKYTPKELEKQNPSLKDTTKGFYDYRSGTLYINPRISLDAKRITIIHEIEHAIQDSVGELPVHTPEDLIKVKRTPYEQRTFELGAKQQQFNALKARGMSLEEIITYWMKRYGYPETSRQELSNELEQFNDIYEEMMPESIMASKQASTNKEADYTNAYWIDPKGKVYQVRGNEVTTEDMNEEGASTHTGWIENNLEMLKRDYGIKYPDYERLMDAGWIRVGDAFGTDWGITLKDLNHIPASVDDLLAKFAPEGAVITLAPPSNYGANYTFEWPVKSIQQTINSIKNRREYYQQQPVHAKQAFKQWTTPEEPTNNSNMDWQWADDVYQYVGENWQDLLSGWMNLDPKNYVKPVIAIEKIYEDDGGVSAWVHIEFVNISGNTDAFMKLIISANIEGHESIEPEGREFSQSLTDWEIDVKDYGVSDELKKASSYGPTNYQGPSVADHDYQNSAWDGMNVTLSDEEDEKFLDQNGADGYPNRWMGRHRGPFYTDEGKVLKMLEETTPQKQTASQGSLPEQKFIPPDLNAQTAIMTDDGSIYWSDEPRIIHVQFIKQLGIPVEHIVSGGRIVDGDYHDLGLRSDTMRYVEQQLAKKRVEQKRKKLSKKEANKGLIEIGTYNSTSVLVPEDLLNSYISVISRTYKDLGEEDAYELDSERTSLHTLLTNYVRTNNKDISFIVADQLISDFAEAVAYKVNYPKEGTQKQAAAGNISLWLAPDGEEFHIGNSSHSAWVESNKEILKSKYNIDLKTAGEIWPLIKSGWVRVDGELPNEIDLQLADIHNIPEYVEQFVWKYKPEVVIVEDLKGEDISFDKEEYSKGLMKQAAISGQVVNTILQLIEKSGGATYNLSKGNLVGTDAYAVAIYPKREQVVPEVDFDNLEGYITQNEDLLNDPNNSFGAWVSNGKTYLDVVATVVDKNEAMALGTQHNQLAIFSLKDMKEIPLQRVAKLAGVYSDKEQQKIYDKIYSERWPDDSAPIDGGNEYYDWSELGSNDYPNPQDLDKERALLDQLENPADRNMPTGLGEYAITYYDAMPAGNDDGGI